MKWKKRKENATQKPLRPLMTSCESRPATVYEDKARKKKEKWKNGGKVGDLMMMMMGGMGGWKGIKESRKTLM